MVKSFRIVVGFDFSEQAELALAQALEAAAGKPGCEVHLVQAVEEATGPRGEHPLQPYDHRAERANAETRLAKRVEALSGVPPTVTVHRHAKLGEPAEVVLRVAHQLEADAVYVGTHGRKGVQRFLLGSVAEQIVRYASCPVIVARPRDYGEHALPQDRD